MVLSVILAAAGAIALPPLDWTCCDNTSISNGIVCIDAPAERPGGGVKAKFDLRPFRRQPFVLSVNAAMRDVSQGKFPWDGLKFQLALQDRLTRQMAYLDGKCPHAGDMRERRISLRYDSTVRDADEGTLWLGLQGCSGRVRFDLGSLRIEATPSAFTVTNQDYRVTYPVRATGSRPLRGVMSPARPMTPDDFSTLREWGVTLLRYQMTGCPKEARTDVNRFRAFVRGKLDHLEQTVLPLAKAAGIRVVVDLHDAPGGRKGMDFALFDDDVFMQCYLDVWREIAQRFKGERQIYGYDFINEPFQTKPAKRDYWEVQRQAAELVRKIDPDATLIVESNHMDAPYTFSYLSPLAMDNVVYEVHMYDPGVYSHQGVRPTDPRGIAYGGTLPSGETLDREYLRRQLEPVRAFEKAHGAKIYVGEFSAICWAPGAGEYLRDCISLFEEYGWDWTYHAFREWSCWSVEHEGDDRNRMRPSDDNPRKRALLEGLRGK